MMLWWSHVVEHCSVGLKAPENVVEERVVAVEPTSSEF
jgi:hypothetical protein